MMPDKIGGRPEGKPGFSLTVISGKPRGGMPDKIGGDPSDDSEPDDLDGSPEQTMDDASREIIAAITAVNPNPKRLKEALRAFVQSCDSNEGNENEGEQESM